MTPTRPNVLLVDDKEANLVALTAQLEDLDCELICAGSGNEALRQLLKRDFALMLLDVQMPDMDGYEVAQFAQDNPSTRDVPIIFVTAVLDTTENALRGYGSGAVDCLFKPINPHILRSKVKVFLELYVGRKRLIDEVAAHKATLDALKHSNDSLRHFTHAASHDLGAPLRAMDGYLEALDEAIGTAIEAEPKHFLDASRRAARRMRSLLDSLLAYARLNKPIALGSVDCGAIVAQVRDDLAERIAKTGAAIDVGPLPTIRGDSDRIYQLFLNLIANALKFHNEGVSPHVSVSCETRSAELVFEVRDEGIGLAPEHVESVFDAFARVHSPNRYEGTGLGLAICRQIVEQHGGRIWAESELGVYTCFSFVLG
jgi:two-component system, sensor histidine kinase and response regulator